MCSLLPRSLLLIVLYKQNNEEKANKAIIFRILDFIINNNCLLFFSFFFLLKKTEKGVDLLYWERGPTIRHNHKHKQDRVWVSICRTARIAGWESTQLWNFTTRVKKGFKLSQRYYSNGGGRLKSSRRLSPTTSTIAVQKNQTHKMVLVDYFSFPPWIMIDC